MPSGPEISYERHGSGEPLVLIHGLGATRRIWQPQLEALAAERDVIALDVPGFGETPPLAEGVEPSPSALGEAIAELCTTLGIERPHLAGNSLGGWVALEMAKAGRAASATLLSPAGLWRNPLGPRKLDTRAVVKRLRPLVLAAARREGPRQRMLSSVVGRPANVPADVGVGLITDWLDAPGYEAANEQMRKHVFTDPDRVEVPVTIAWGDRDTLVAKPKPERYPPGARLVVLEGCGHTPNWDEPDLVTELVLSGSAGAERRERPEAVA